MIAVINPKINTYLSLLLFPTKFFILEMKYGHDFGYNLSTLRYFTPLNNLENVWPRKSPTFTSK
jgi:hypothetical protein